MNDLFIIGYVLLMLVVMRMCLCMLVVGCGVMWLIIVLGVVMCVLNYVSRLFLLCCLRNLCMLV